VLGGQGADGSPLASVESCDADACRLEAALPEAVAFASAQLTASGLVVAGGRRADGTTSGRWLRLDEGAYVDVELRTGSGEPVPAAEAVLFSDLDGRALRLGGTPAGEADSYFASPSGSYHPELDAVSYAYFSIDDDSPLRIRRAAGVTMMDGRLVLIGGRDAEGLRADAIVVGTVRATRIDADTIAITAAGSTVYLDDPRTTLPLGTDDGTSPVYLSVPEGASHTVVTVAQSGRLRVEVPAP
jgi:hypothetical protein